MDWSTELGRRPGYSSILSVGVIGLNSRTNQFSSSLHLQKNPIHTTTPRNDYHLWQTDDDAAQLAIVQGDLQLGAPLRHRPPSVSRWSDILIHLGARNSSFPLHMWSRFAPEGSPELLDSIVFTSLVGSASSSRCTYAHTQCVKLRYPSGMSREDSITRPPKHSRLATHGVQNVMQFRGIIREAFA